MWQMLARSRPWTTLNRNGPSQGAGPHSSKLLAAAALCAAETELEQRPGLPEAGPSAWLLA